MEKPDEPLEDAPEIEFKQGHDVDSLARRVAALEEEVARLLKAELVRQNIVSYTPDP